MSQSPSITAGNIAAGLDVPVLFRTPWKELVSRTVMANVYLMVSWPLQLALFCVNLTLLAVCLSVVLAPFALPVAIIVAAVAAKVECALIRNLLGMPAHESGLPRKQPDEAVAAYAVRVVGGPQTWLNIAWSVIAWVVSTITWTLTIIWWAVAFGCLTWPLWGWIPDRDGGGIADIMGVHSFWLGLPINILAGVVALVTLPTVTVGLAKGQGLFASSLLCLTGQEERIEALTESRDAGRKAEAAKLARLERDIHDGPQQRLVRLKLDLARVERQLGPDSPVAQDLRAAIAATQATLDELRALSKGIAPPVLADRGLAAAVREAAGRSLIPVIVQDGLDGQTLPPHVEQAAYFVVAEALTNVAKHSHATRGLVSLEAVGDDLLVSVTDDGQGGAHLAKGQGLVGLETRVRSVGGTLRVDSPPAGGTSVMASFPLA